MRAKERIPKVLKYINWQEFIDFLGFENSTEYALKCEQDINHITFYWEQNPDLRLTQVLVGCILPNIPGSWFYVEETDYLINEKGVDPGELLFWGSYGKDGKGPLRRIALNDLDADHMEAIIKTQKQINPKYKKIIIKNLRKKKLESLNH